MAQSAPNPDHYYVPHGISQGSHWPMVGSVGLFTTVLGAASWMNGSGWGQWMMYVGFAILIGMMFGWFGAVIRESVKGYYNKQVDVSFRMGMVWFIFSEVMFFAAFFFALFYTRYLVAPWLGGDGDGMATHEFLWQNYSAVWPTNGPAQIGGPFETIPAWGLPFINTALLLASGVTLTIAHHALFANARKKLLVFLGLTIVLGCIFLFFQAEEYIHAYQELGLTLGSGIYGSTFFMLTGFHGMHVTLGVIMLTVIWFRCAFGHFDAENHFGFEAVAWYWHFVDVVWLALFLFVYIM